jgi:CRISPR/Cas system-associated exonuclease Cas4 (RecB family)
MAERVFPRKLHEDPLLLDEARSHLDALALKSQTTRSSQERLLLRLCVGAAEKQLLFSYARVQMPEARAQVPSFYALDLMRALTGTIPDHSSMQLEADRASDARLAWPAPEVPAHAIDDLEHDLATLRPLLSSTGEDARGGAAYLLKLNEHLARALRSRYARWDHRWGVYDGLVRTSAAVAPALEARRLTVKAYSVSALQKFAVCPYQFLLSAVHRLETRKTAVPLEEMDPLTRGALFHEVQAAFLRMLDDRGALPVTSETLATCQALLDDTLTRHARQWQEKLAPAIDRVWDAGIAAMRTDLRTWLHHVAEDSQWIPKYFELGIGFPPEKGRDPRSIREPAELDNGYLLHGFLDLVEENAGDGTLRVTDHKTGRNHTDVGMVTGHGEHLQPILYGMAAEKALGKNVKEARLFFCTSAGGYEERTVSLVPELHRSYGRDVLRVIDDAVSRGSLVPLPREKACERCDFVDVCGPREAVRVGRKQRGLANVEVHSLITDLELLRGNP